MTNNILVIGGTGKTGRRVVERLQKKGKNVRIGSRSQDPMFEWGDSSTWAKTLENIDKAYIVYYPDLAVPGAFEAIKSFSKTAKDAGVKKVVLLSGKGEKEAERCEQVIAESGMDYTLVRASWFNQNFSESFFLDPIIAGHVALPMPHAKIPFVDANDIADVVTAALLDDKHNGQTYEITGPRLLTFSEVVQEISNSLGREIKYESISLEEYNEQMKSLGVPADYIWLFDYLFKEVLGNEKNSVICSDVQKVLLRKAKDFSEFAKEVAQTGIWNQ